MKCSEAAASYRAIVRTDSDEEEVSEYSVVRTKSKTGNEVTCCLVRSLVEALCHGKAVPLAWMLLSQAPGCPALAC